MSHIYLDIEEFKRNIEIERIFDLFHKSISTADEIYLTCGRNDIDEELQRNIIYERIICNQPQQLET